MLYQETRGFEMQKGQPSLVDFMDPDFLDQGSSVLFPVSTSSIIGRVGSI